MEEYRRWEDNVKMDLKEIGVDVMSQLTGKLFPQGLAFEYCFDLFSVNPDGAVYKGEALPAVFSCQF